MYVIVPKFIKIGQTVAEIWRFNGFQHGHRPHVGFLKLNFLTASVVKKPILHQRTKFRKDWSNRCRDIAISVIFKMAATAILERSIRCKGNMCVDVPNIIQIGQTIAEIWRFNAFENGGRRPC